MIFFFHSAVQARVKLHSVHSHGPRFLWLDHPDGLMRRYCERLCEIRNTDGVILLLLPRGAAALMVSSFSPEPTLLCVDQISPIDVGLTHKAANTNP